MLARTMPGTEKRILIPASASAGPNQPLVP